MPKLILPYPSSSLTETGRTGKMKFGICETEVDIPECPAAEFSLAVTKLYNSHTSTGCYERQGCFWYNACRPFSTDKITFDGFKSEIPLPDDTNSTKGWLRNIGLEILGRTLDARAIDNGNRLKRDSSNRVAISARLRNGDGHEEDRNFFEAWASENLVWSDGRLMKRIHSPSLFIGWRTEKFLLDNSVEPLRATSYWHTYGCHDFRPGLHYRIDDPAFFEKWAETRELYPQKACDLVDLPMMRYHDAARRVLGTIADAPHIAIHDNLVVDRRILERIETDGW